MVDVKELRIGNVLHVKYEYKAHIVHSIDKCDTFNGGYAIRMESGLKCSLDYAEPVLLTEGLLLKCGFKEKQWEDEDDPPVFYKNGLTISCKTWGKDSFYLNSYDIDVTFLHQLQNIYYALTGKELEVEL